MGMEEEKVGCKNKYPLFFFGLFIDIYAVALSHWVFLSAPPIFLPVPSTFFNFTATPLFVVTGFQKPELSAFRSRSYRLSEVVFAAFRSWCYRLSEAGVIGFQDRNSDET